MSILLSPSDCTSIKFYFKYFFTVYPDFLIKNKTPNTSPIFKNKNKQTENNTNIYN